MPIIGNYTAPRVSLRRRSRCVQPAVCLPVPSADVFTNTGIKGNPALPATVDHVDSATNLVERYINRVLVAQTWDQYYDDIGITYPSIFFSSWMPLDSPFRDYALSFVRSPLLSVLGVYVTDDYGSETQVDPSLYYVSSTHDPGRIALTPGSYWPYHRPVEGFRIRYIAGYAVPFTASQGTLTLFPNPYVGGEFITVKPGLNDGLPSGITDRMSYQIDNVQGNTVQLLDPDNNLVETIDTSQQGSYSFLGAIPEPIRREISLMASGKDDSPEQAGRGKKTSGSSKGSQHVDYLEGYEERLKYFRLITI